MKNRERKIRKLLGDKFHLCISYENSLDDPKWSLYRNYVDSKVYFSNDNKIIMSSETNTIDDLYEYAKEHHQIDEHFIMSKSNVIIAWIFMLITIINIILFKNDILRGFIFGVDIMIIFYSILSYIIWNKNWKVRMLELRENLKKISSEDIDVKDLKKINICKSCGKQFDLVKENKYIVQENKGLNGIATGTKKFECFDCPHCGCQNILNIREG